MAYKKQPIYDIDGNTLLPETTMDQVKESTEESARSLDTIVSSMSTDIEDLKTSVSNIDSLSMAVDTLDASVKALSTDVSTLETTVSSLGTTIATEVLGETEELINNKITFGTTDLESGVSPLTTGSLYVVYEA